MTSPLVKLVTIFLLQMNLSAGQYYWELPRDINVDCCRIDQFDNEFKWECILDYIQDSLSSNGVDPGPCVVDCVFRSKQIITSRGYLNLYNVPQDWRPVYEICQYRVWPNTPSIGGCPSYAFNLDQCAQYYMLYYCPRYTSQYCGWRSRFYFY